MEYILFILLLPLNKIFIKMNILLHIVVAKVFSWLCRIHHHINTTIYLSTQLLIVVWIVPVLEFTHNAAMNILIHVC